MGKDLKDSEYLRSRGAGPASPLEAGPAHESDERNRRPFSPAPDPRSVSGSQVTLPATLTLTTFPGVTGKPTRAQADRGRRNHFGTPDQPPPANRCRGPPPTRCWWRWW